MRLTCALALALAASSCAHESRRHRLDDGDPQYWPNTFDDMIASTGAPEHVLYAAYRGGSAMFRCSPSYFFAVRDDGTVTYDGFNAVREAGRHEWKLPARWMEKLRARASALDLVQVPARAIRGRLEIYDANPSCLLVRSNEKTWSFCTMNVNQQLSGFRSYLEFAANLLQWTGTPASLPECQEPTLSAAVDRPLARREARRRGTRFLIAAGRLARREPAP